jgi:hypothetical protein
MTALADEFVAFTKRFFGFLDDRGFTSSTTNGCRTSLF